MKSVGTRFLMPIGIIGVLFLVCVFYQTYVSSRKHAYDLISQQAAMALEFNLAIRGYARENILPVMEKFVDQDTFIPETMSTSFISRSIFEKVKKKFPGDIVRFASDNPRNPINRATPEDERMIEYFRLNPLVNRRTEEIQIEGRRYLAYFSPMMMKQECLRCHSDPKDAPADLIKRYGSTASFHRKLGDVVGLDRVAFPVDAINASLASEMRYRSIVLAVAFALLFGSIFYIFRFVVTRRLVAMANHFDEIAAQTENGLMTPLEVKGNDEISVVGRAFNKLVEKLRATYASLEQRVSERTEELHHVNAQLQLELTERKRAGEALLDSEEKYRGLIETTNTGYVIIDLEGKVLDANSEYVRLSGHKELKEILGRSVAEWTAEQDRERNVLEVMKCVKNGSVRNLEINYAGKDGMSIPVEINATTITTLKGSRIITLIRDISRRKHAEEGLQESEQRFRTMFENAADVMLVADINTKKFLMGNKMASEVLGYSLDEIRQLGVMDIHPREALPSILEQFERQKKSGNGVTQDLPVKRKDGSVFYADVNTFPIIIDEKRYLIGVFRDITTRRQGEQVLKETNAKLEMMVSEMNQRNREAALINGLLEALQSCLSVKEAYPIIARCIQQLFEFCSGTLFMLDPDSNLLEVVTFWGNTPVGEQVFTPDDCWAVRRNRVHISGGSIHEEGCCRHLPDKASGCYLCIPLMAQGETLGLLLVQTADEVDAFVIDNMKHVAVTIGDNISLALANIRLRETLRRQVIHDPLTGLFNRRYLDETLKREIARVRRKKAPLGVIMMDLDYFKRFNDTYGHEAGDSLLETLGKFLESQVRQGDVVCRYGGEEFVLILPETSLDVTQKRAEEIRQGVSRLRVSHRGRVLEMVTISLGVAMFPEHGTAEDDLLRAADTAMYQAKAAGRNRVVVAESSKAPSRVVE